MGRSVLRRLVLSLVGLVTAAVVGLTAQQPRAGGGQGTGGGGGRGQGIPGGQGTGIPGGQGRGQAPGSQGQGARDRAQQPPPASQPTFRSEINAVLVDFRVVDSDGRFVRGLTREDIRVFENDVEQTVTTFELVDIPIEPPREPGASSLVSPDVATNIGTEDGRLYVIVLDDVSGQGSSLRAPTVRALAREFIEQHMTDADRAAVMSTTGRADIAAEFTNDRRRLIAAVEKFEGNYGQTFSGACQQFRTTARSLESLSRWLSQINGRRKAIVLITERMGSDAPMWDGYSIDTISNLECENVELARVIDAASGGNVSIYIVDPVGVPTGPARGIKPVYIDDDAIFNQSRRQSLTVLAQATGGFALVNSNDFSGAFRGVVEDNSSYYLLGYSPTTPAADGKFRRIRVEVGRSGLRVRARSGYVASDRPLDARFYRGNLPPSLMNLLQSPVSLPGLAMSVSALPIRGNGSRAIVPILVGLDDTVARANGQEPVRPLDVVVAAADKNGSVKDMRRLEVEGQRLLVRMELNPGRYHLRVAGTDASGRLQGSVLHDFDVPDYTDGRLGMSALVLGSGAESKRPIGGFDEEWRRLLRVPPTTAREFSAEDELLVGFEVYDQDDRSAHRVDITTSVLTENGAVAHRVTAAEERPRGGTRLVTFSQLVTVPLSKLSPGAYVLAVEAQSAARADARVSRQVAFRVR
jgi:VWFA-related protein